MKISKEFNELAEKAGVWWPQGCPSAEGGNEAWMNTALFEKDELQAFAESIVSECIKQLWTEECNTSDLALEEFNRKANTIKDRFGMRK